MKNNEKEIEVVTYETDIVWSDGAVEVVYAHDNDNFEVWAFGYMGWEFRSEFDKSADAVEAAKNLARYEG
jgi:hypothetical protein